MIVLGEVAEIRRLDRSFPEMLPHRYEPTLREFLDASEYFDVARIGAGHPRLSTLLEPADRAALGALAVPDLWDLERKSDVDLDRIYGDGTVELRGRMEALVFLRWRRDGAGLGVRRLSVDEALAALPLVYKNLGAFDLDRVPGSGITDAERACYRELFARITVAEVTGRVDFSALVPVIDELLSA